MIFLRRIMREGEGDSGEYPFSVPALADLSTLDVAPDFPTRNIVTLTGANDKFPGYASAGPVLAEERINLLRLLCLGSQYGAPSRAMEITVRPEWIPPSSGM